MFKIGDKVRYRVPTREELEAEGTTEEDTIPFSGAGTIMQIDTDSILVDWIGNGNTNLMYPCELQKVVQGKGFLPSWL